MSTPRESVAKIVVFNEKGQVLVLRTSEHRIDPTKTHIPDLPGGLVEEGETPIVGAVRELDEETGITISPNDAELFYTETKFHEATANSVSKFLFATKVQAATVQLSWEHDEYHWLSIDDFLATKWRPFYRTAINYAMRHHLFEEYLV